MEVLPKRSRWVWRKDDLFTGSCFLLFGSVRRGYSLTALISLEMQGFLHWHMIDFEGFFTWHEQVTARCRWQTRTPVLPKAGVRLLRLILDLQARFSSTTLRGLNNAKKKRWHKVLTPIGAELQLNQHYSFQRFPKVSSSSCLLKRHFFSFFGCLVSWGIGCIPCLPCSHWRCDLVGSQTASTASKAKFLGSSHGKGRFDIEIKDFYGLFMGRMFFTKARQTCGACEFLSPERSWQWHVHGLSFGDFWNGKAPKNNQVDML